MGRWEPDAAERLREAALELFATRGFEQTTVRDIAHHAGLTARTFFRHFADKREVLFAGSELLEERAVAALDAAPAHAPSLDAIVVALDAAAELIGATRDAARRRRSIIQANAVLQERELIKFASMSAALERGLQHRGVDASTARLAAETGVALYRASFDLWLSGADGAELRDVIRSQLAQLREMVVSLQPSESTDQAVRGRLGS